MVGRAALWVALASLTSLAGQGLNIDTAHAGGFWFPENGSKALGRGGAYMLGPKGPEVLIANPAMLSKLRGHQLTLDANLVGMDAEFTRAPEGDETFETVKDDWDGTLGGGFSLNPVGFVSSDLGQKNFTLALGAYGPHAMQGREFPADGAQRYMVTKVELFQAYYTLAAAYHWNGLRVGAAAQAVNVKVDYNLNLTAIGNDIKSNVDVEAWAPSGLFGLAYDISPSLSVGASYKLPIDFEAEGSVSTELPEEISTIASLDGDEAAFVIHDPAVIRAGVRYAHLDGKREVFDVEAQFAYEMWSGMEGFNVQTNLVGMIGAAEVDVPPINLAKNWEDVMSFRLGGSYNATDMITGRLGGFYETATVPSGTTHLDFLAHERIGGGAGLTVKLADLDLDFAYSYIYSPDRTVTDGELRVIEPLNANAETPVHNNGDYHVAYQIYSVGLTYRFDQ